jgi:hypothetical protein
LFGADWLLAKLFANVVDVHTQVDKSQQNDQREKTGINGTRMVSLPAHFLSCP